MIIIYHYLFIKQIYKPVLDKSHQYLTILDYDILGHISADTS